MKYLIDLESPDVHQLFIIDKQEIPGTFMYNAKQCILEAEQISVLGTVLFIMYTKPLGTIT